MLLNTTSTIQETAWKVLCFWDIQVKSYALSNFGCYEDQIATLKAACGIWVLAAFFFREREAACDPTSVFVMIERIWRMC